MVGVCISPIKRDAEHFSMHLLATCMFLWENVYLDPVPIFQSDWAFVVLVVFAIELYDSLYILQINPLSDLCFGNVCSL